MVTILPAQSEDIQEVAPMDVPGFLQERFEYYNAQGMDLVLMRRLPTSILD
jgi:hypothetical protein